MTTQLETANKLALKLDAELPALEKYDRYFSGRVPLEFLAPEISEATKGRLRALTVPWPRVVVNAIKERLVITGFRTGDQVAAGLWSMWQRDNLDEYSLHAHEDALVHGRAFLLVWANPDGTARITVESAKECWVQFRPGSRVRQYGIRRYLDNNLARLDLFTPDKVVRFTGGEVADPALMVGITAFQYSDTIPNPLGRVPLIPLVNRPRTMTPYGTSELSDLLPLFDSLAKLMTDLMVSSEFSAMPRRWATGLTLPEKRDPGTGQPTGEIDPAEAFSPLAGRLWISEKENAKFGEFSGSNLGGYTNAITTLTEALAAAACLPSHYLGITTANPASADAIRSSEAALVNKVRERQRSYEAAWEEAMRLASAVETGRFDPALDSLEVQWADPATRTLAQDADAVLKLVAAGVLPPDAGLELIGFSATQVARINAMRQAAPAPTTPDPTTTEGAA